MKNEIEQAIKEIAIEIKSIPAADFRMKASQAVLNLANALAVLERIEELRQQMEEREEREERGER